MKFRLVVALALGVALAACSGGGGDSDSFTTPSVPWARFRGDQSNTGAGGGAVASAASAAGPIHSLLLAPEGGAAAPISASPAIGSDHTVYIGTEAGEFFALTRDPTTGELAIKWRLAECAPTAAAAVPFGPIRSSPALTAVRSDSPLSEQNDKVLYFGDDTGHLYAVQDREDGPRCLWAFKPPAEDSAIVSSPVFLIDLYEQIITGIYFGSTGGYFYAVNQDGSLKWQYPRAGQPPLGAITSSPAVDSGGPLYFTAADGNLYALNLDGNKRFSFPLGTVSTTFASSPARSSSIYVGTEDGAVWAVNSDGTRKWRFAVPNREPIVASVAISITGIAPPTPTPTVTPIATPTPGGVTPTATPALQLRTIVFAIARDGAVYPLDDSAGGQIAAGFTVAGFTVAAGAAATMSSPALSSDGCLVFGDDAGALNIRHLEEPASTTPTPTTGKECRGGTVVLNPETAQPFAIRSSPAIDSTGVIYLGADDGRLYAIGSES